LLRSELPHLAVFCRDDHPAKKKHQENRGKHRDENGVWWLTQKRAKQDYGLWPSQLAAAREKGHAALGGSTIRVDRTSSPWFPSGERQAYVYHDDDLKRLRDWYHPRKDDGPSSQERHPAVRPRGRPRVAATQKAKLFYFRLYMFANPKNWKLARIMELGKRILVKPVRDEQSVLQYCRRYQDPLGRPFIRRSSRNP
jgi:hypothetical protein